jgi:hypothetical protein
MTARLLRTLVTLAVSVILIVVAVATAGQAAAAIPDRTFQLLGCNVGDYSCFYGKLGGSPYGYYCSNGYYTCTNGIPDTPPQNQQNVSPYCGDGGGTGCINGSPLYVSTGTVVSNSNGLSSAVVVTSGFVAAGPDGKPLPDR